MQIVANYQQIARMISYQLSNVASCKNIKFRITGADMTLQVYISVRSQRYQSRFCSNHDETCQIYLGQTFAYFTDCSKNIARIYDGWQEIGRKIEVKNNNLCFLQLS